MILKLGGDIMNFNIFDIIYRDVYFLENGHRERTYELCFLSNINEKVFERAALFYLISSDQNTFNIFKKHFYNFEHDEIISPNFKKLQLPPLEERLLRLGLDLYNVNYKNKGELQMVIQSYSKDCEKSMYETLVTIHAIDIIFGTTN